ncbi:hypothetical protein, partial [Enterococcus gilvus]|uniref:hypothetical protein n=1 Tax=Enterococcus gilvus TaxID=160453 RepID=UPI001C54D358
SSIFLFGATKCLDERLNFLRFVAKLLPSVRNLARAAQPFTSPLLNFEAACEKQGEQRLR